MYSSSIGDVVYIINKYCNSPDFVKAGKVQQEFENQYVERTLKHLRKNLPKTSFMHHGTFISDRILMKKVLDKDILNAKC